MHDEPVLSDLDPVDWGDFRARAHALLDVCLDHVAGVRDREVWRPVPDAARATIATPPSFEGRDLDDVLGAFTRAILPYPTGNTHPRFFGWVHGGGTPVGILAEMAAATMNANCGGRDHAAIYVERAVIDWCKGVFGFPDAASGILVAGTSMASVIALNAVRTARVEGVRKAGLRGAPPLVGYASAQAHTCLAKAFEVTGLGSDALRRVPINAAHALDLGALRAQIAADREAGLSPFFVGGTLGTVNTGACDDIEALADIAAEEGLWLHVDGAFGAWARIAGDPWAAYTRGVERADSLVFDFHKWMSVPYDAGCVLIRDAAAHRAAFAERPDYLAAGGRALAGGEPWFTDYGIDLSRGFRALKVWFALQHFGVERLGAAIAGNCRTAAYLAERVEASPELELMAPVRLNVCCFRHCPEGVAEADLDAHNAETVTRLQERGIAAPSTTRIDGRLVIRVAIVNHRTRREDIDALLEALH